MSLPGVTIGRPNFHEGPDVSSPVVRWLPTGTALDVINLVAGTEYFEVTLTSTGEHGYIHQDYVRPSSDNGSHGQGGSTAVVAKAGFFAADAAFAVVPLAPANPAAGNSTEAFIWNQYGGLLTALSQSIGIAPAVAVAVLTNESGGHAFGSNGNLLIRFENHIFNNEWGQTHPTDYAAHFAFGSPSWTGHVWRPDAGQWRNVHESQASEWEAFNFACTLDDTAAKRSISMGLTQVMGFNFATIGYNSVQDMFTAFSEDARRQVLAFFDFVRVNNGIIWLQSHDYGAFANMYNGSGAVERYRSLIEGSIATFGALGVT